MALGRELALLGFVSMVTYLATDYISVVWSPAPYTIPGVAALVAGSAVLPALVRHRFPLTTLLAAALLFGWYPAAGVILALASYGVAGRVRSARRRGFALGVAALMPFTIGLIGSGYQWKIAFAVFGIAALVCVAGPAMVHVLLGQRERLINALLEQASYAASTAKLQERSRIAQEMHDLLGHRLSLISLYAGSLELDTTKPTHITEPARLIRETVHTAMDELRTTLGILRQQGPAAATLPTDHTGTWPDVSRLVHQAQAGGLNVALSWIGPDTAAIALPIRQAVHRIIREGLTNVSKHAPTAAAGVIVEHAADRIRVGVVDEGQPGTAAPGSGLGLVGVRERIRLLGGSSQAGPLPGRGFRVTAELPLSMTPPRPVEPDAGTDVRTDDRWARAGMSAVLATGLIGAVAILVVTFNTLTFDLPTTFDSVHIGSTRAQITNVIGKDDPVARLASRGLEPPLPGGTDCWYTYNLMESGTTIVERYCFRDDIVVQKARFALPI